MNRSVFIQPGRVSLQSGFSMMEMLLALTLMGVLASLLIPVLNNQVGQAKLVDLSKDAATQIAQAFSKYQKNNLATGATAADDIIAQMNTVRIISDGSQQTNIQYVPVSSYGNAGTASNANISAKNYDGTPSSTAVDSSGNNYYQSVVTLCSAPSPCAMLQSGAILQYTTGATFGTPNANQNLNGLLFIFDPDGSGMQPGVSFVLTLNGRVTTLPYAAGSTTAALNATFTGDALPHGDAVPDIKLGHTTDPDYILPWTNG